jgi:hypothetical protein
MTICRVCEQPFEPEQAHFHTCRSCFRAGDGHSKSRPSPSPAARLAAMPGQLSFADLPEWEIATSEYLAYERKRERERDAA